MAERLDRYLVTKGFARSRERAKALISEGKVLINGKPADKASILIDDGDRVEAGEDIKYVGRGALKLIKAIDCFEIDLSGRICGDLGASTGGFTQVMLERGAERVYAVDVGHGQLDEMLVNDSRVIDLEGVNVKELDESLIPEKLPFISADLSFISLKNITDVFCRLLTDDGCAVVLIKPQFEAGRQALNKKGIVTAQADHIRVLNELIDAFSPAGLFIHRLTFSPVRGGSGNIEYLALLKKTPAKDIIDFRSVVKEAFVELRK